MCAGDRRVCGAPAGAGWGRAETSSVQCDSSTGERHLLRPAWQKETREKKKKVKSLFSLSGETQHKEISQKRNNSLGISVDLSAPDTLVYTCLGHTVASVM